MFMKMRIASLLLMLGSLIACATSPLGRKQFLLVGPGTMDRLGGEAFQKMKETEAIEKDPKVNQYVQCIVNPMVALAGGGAAGKQWEVVVFNSSQVNAFALPGGKIGVYTGLLNVANTPDQLAAVLGHEVGHVIAQHGAERVSQQMGTSLGLAAVHSIAGKDKTSDQLVALLGLGVQFGILLPFSRDHESEADLIGLDLMAQAGFDPRQSVQLWKNMSVASGGKSVPEWMSTHPSNDTRIAQLEAHLADAIQKSDQAHSSGRMPSCQR